LQNAREVNAEPSSVPSISLPGAMPRSAAAVSMTATASGGAAADVERPAGDLASAAVDRGVHITPAVLGDPDAGDVHVPELIGPLDAEVARSLPSAFRAAASQHAVLAHQQLHALAVHRPDELA
jgi:hypothetical protein